MKPQTPLRASFRVGPYTVDAHAEEVKKGITPMSLSNVAFQVFYQLVVRRGAVVLREEFEPWCKTHDRGRLPLDVCIMQLRRALGHSIIKTVHGKGYRLAPKFAVETIPSPSFSALDKRINVVLEMIKAHSSSSFIDVIKKCEKLRSTGQIAEAYPLTLLSYINLGHTGFCRLPHKETISKAREITDEALELLPPMGSIFALRGLTYLIYEYDWIKAEEDFNKALSLSPQDELAHCFLAHLQIAQGRFEEGLAHARTAAEVDYDSPMTVITEPWFMLFAGQVADAVRKGEEVAEELIPCAPVHDLLGHIHWESGATHRAIEHYEKALEIDFLPDAVASLGFIYARMGERKKALGQLAVLEQAKRDKRIAYVSSYYEALVRAGLREKSRCLNALEKAFEERCDWLIYLAVEPRWRELRTEKRFLSLLRRIGITKPKWA